MGIVIGGVLALLGAGGTIWKWSSISDEVSRHRYTYSAPFTSHEMGNITVLILSILALVAGIILVIFAIIRKRNHDTLHRVERMQGGGKTQGVCPSCGLNVSRETKNCPKCGAEIAGKGK